MAETTRTFTCTRCDESFQRVCTVGRKPQHCQPCKLEIKRAAGRAYIAKVYVKRVPGLPEIFQCGDCNDSFEHTRSHGQTPIRCRSCQKDRNAAMTAERRRERGRVDLKFAPGKRSYPCAECNVDIPCASTGRKPERCGECAKTRTARLMAERQRREPRPPITCIDCSIEVALPLRGASRQKRCAECAVKAARVIQRRMSHERRALKLGASAEQFTDQEIFERDRWKCGICTRRINPKLRHPHSQSVSLDHIIPLTKGGDHTRANVQAAHLTCNLRKYNIGGGEQLLLVG